MYFRRIARPVIALAITLFLTLSNGANITMAEQNNAVFPGVITVDTYGGIWVENYTANNTITIQLYTSNGGSLIWENTSLPTDGDGSHFSHYNTLGCNFIQPGNYIKVIDNDSADFKAVEYPNLAITNVNTGTAQVTGTTDASQEVTVFADDQNSQDESVVVVADGFGDWTADFTSVGSTMISTRARVEIYDIDGDIVRYYSSYNNYDRHQTLVFAIHINGTVYDACPDQTVLPWSGWLAKTSQQVQDYLDALNPFTITLDGFEILATADALQYWGAIEPFVMFDSGTLITAYVSWFAYATDLGAGENFYIARLGLSTQVFDGWDNYGPGILWDNTTVTVNMPASSTQIFTDGFESGNTSAWIGVNTGNGDLYVCAAAAMKGGNGACVDVVSQKRKQVWDRSMTDASRYRVRFYFDPNGLSMGNNEKIRLMQLRTGVDTIRPAFVQVRYIGGMYEMRVRAQTDAGVTLSSNWYPITDDVVVVEIDWMAATGDGNDDGYVTLWLNGVKKGTISGIDNDTLLVNEVKLGFTSRLGTKAISGTFYLDAFVSDASAYIGLLP